MQLVALHCPGCGEDVIEVPPINWIGLGPTPAFSHVSDRTALCPKETAYGYLPSEAIEHQADTA